MSDSVRPHGQQPTRLLCPRDSPGKNTGVDFHVFLQKWNTIIEKKSVLFSELRTQFSEMEDSVNLLSLSMVINSALSMWNFQASFKGGNCWGPEKTDLTFTFHFHALEKEMATHSSVLAWRIPGTGEPGGLPYVALHRVGHNWSDLAAAAEKTAQIVP